MGTRGYKRVKVKRARPNKVMMKGVRMMEAKVVNQERMTCLSNSRNIAQNQMKKKGLTPKDMMKFIDSMSEDDNYDN